MIRQDARNERHGENRNATGTAHGISFSSAALLSQDERLRHERYMSEALDEARDVPAPFGAVIVDRRNGEIVGRGGNQSHTGNRILHGEIVALSSCAGRGSDLDWAELTLYTTAEPCPMCAGAIVWSGIGEVVFGTSIQTLTNLGINQIRLESPTVAAAAPFYSGRIIGGVLADQTDKLFSEWAATWTP